MSSVDSLKRQLDSLKRRLPQGDVEFDVYGFDREMPDDGSEVIVIDLVGALRALEYEDDNSE